jgi:two-component sensor histidine kinase
MWSWVGGSQVNLLSVLRPVPRDRPWRGVAAGAGLFGLAAVARWKLGGLAEGFGPMLLLPSILLAGLLGGIRVGLGVTAVCFLIAWTWFFPPYGTFILEPQDTITIAAFTVTAALELYVIRVLKLTIDELSLAKERSTTMFRELQHRVANNLQVVAGLLRQEQKKLGRRDDPGFQALARAQQRLDLMVRVHRSLNSPSIVDLPLDVYLQALAQDLIESGGADVRLSVSAPPVQLDVEHLMPVSMIVAEAVTNALKYAYQDRACGNLSVSLGVRGRAYDLAISDDGPGFPPDRIQPRRGSLGCDILESLVRQLGGTLSFEGGPGATVRVVFPI